MEELYACYTGGAFSITPEAPISWVNSNPSNGRLDIALLCNQWGPANMKFLVHKFSGNQTELTMRIWRGLHPGVYEVRVGLDQDQNDWADSVLFTKTVEVRDHYTEVDLDPLVADGQYVIDLVWTGPATSLTTHQPDLAVGIGDLQPDGSGGYEVVLHNLGGVDYEVSSDQQALGEHAVIRVYDAADVLVAYGKASTPGSTYVLPAALDRTPSYKPVGLTIVAGQAVVSGDTYRVAVNWSEEEIAKVNNEAMIEAE